MAVGFPVKDDYATGDVLTAANMNDFAGTLNTVPDTIGAYAAGKNKIINGALNIWQRGTSFSNPTDGQFVADRFNVARNGTGATRTVSQQAFTAGTAPVAGYEGTFFLRLATTVAGSGETYYSLQQKIEDVRTFAGETATISFWAKADATRAINFGLIQNFGSGGSPSVFPTGLAANLTTSWVRYSHTIALPSIAGKTIGTGSFLTASITLPLNSVSTIDIWGVQVEAGSIATPFQTATGTIQGELAAAQRYYQRTFAGANYGRISLLGMAETTTSAQMGFPTVVPMRISPSSVDFPTVSTLRLSDIASGTTVTGVTLSAQSNRSNPMIVVTVASGLTAFRPYYLEGNNDANAYIGFNAEL